MRPRIEMLNAVAGALDASDDVLAILEQRHGSLFLLEMNDAFRRMGDYRANDLLGCDFATIVAPESAHDFGRMCEAAVAGNAFRGELLALARLGRRYWFGLHMMPSDTRAERSGLFVVLGRDITKPRAAGEQSTAAQAMLARVFMLADAAIAILDAEGRFAMTNAAYERMMGGRSADWAGKLALDIVEPASRPKAVEARRQQFIDGKPYRIAVDALTIEGKPLPIIYSSTMVERSDKQFFRIITVNPDIARVPAHIKIHGKLKLITLAAVRDHMGARYQTVSDRVMATVEHVLSHRLGTHDSFVRTPTGDFCICFSELDDDEATLRAAAIAHEIRAKLIGDDVPAIVVIDPPAASRKPPQLKLTKLRSAIGGQIAAHFAQLLEWTGRPVSPDQHEPDGSLLERDTTCLRCAIEQIGKLRQVMVPVAFEHFMQRPTTERFFSVARELMTDPEVGRNVILMFDHLPRGLAISRARDVVQRLLPFHCGMGFLIDELESRIHEVSNGWFGVDARQLDSNGSFPPPALARFCLQVHTSRGRVWVHHVASPAVTRQLAAVGVDYVSFEGDEGR